MKHRATVQLALATACGVATIALAQSPATGEGAGWTGLTAPAEVIAARRTLMIELENLMRPVDAYAAGDAKDSAELRAAAGAVTAMLLATPHLFPPTTNLFDPADETPVTLALPAVWQSFAAFEGLAAAAVATASRMAVAGTEAELRDAARALRGSCDACHAPYLRPYVPSGVSSEDLDFDFESVLPGN